MYELQKYSFIRFTSLANFLGRMHHDSINFTFLASIFYTNGLIIFILTSKVIFRCGVKLIICLNIENFCQVVFETGIQNSQCITPRRPKNDCMYMYAALITDFKSFYVKFTASSGWVRILVCNSKPSLRFCHDVYFCCEIKHLCRNLDCSMLYIESLPVK